ncbi:hypothetical protein NEMBOFW57_002008 [Staphylotrichum longicolle]|uniref:RING-type domain-containing protein n=1 Tax=Staphylotrichum longicolle TaxID=669026 RepID=A0AAD4HYC3_9PEZI|nr:hypothetical protein NEMBOFW57_002008 [Staphylotrichum longicolle]
MGADTGAAYTAAPSATPPSSSRKRMHPDPAANSASTKRRSAIPSQQATLTSDARNDAQQTTPSKKTRFRRHNEETVELTGSTGNIYTVTVARQPRCDCPHARRSANPITAGTDRVVGAGDAVTQCKHVVYVLARVLRARFELVYQLALLEGEVREVLEGAPPPVAAGDDEDGWLMGTGGGKRKPVEGDCPICFCEMEVGGEAVVWCRAACGQNVHRACFETWAATKRRQQRGAGGGGGGEVTCPYCRSVWEGDEDMVKAIRRNGEKNAEGYRRRYY